MFKPSYLFDKVSEQVLVHFALVWLTTLVYYILSVIACAQKWIYKTVAKKLVHN